LLHYRRSTLRVVEGDAQGKERYVLLGTPESYTQLTAAKTKAGVNIYRAIAESTGCKQFVFDSEVNFTIGYLLSLAQ
jgi:hypothetical protein